MKLTTKSRYGTRMILDIAVNGTENPVPVSDIARRQNISLKYLEKLISKLKPGNILKSHRGPFGGQKLARPASEITVGELVRLLENRGAITDCAETDAKNCSECHQAGECITQWVWIEASKAMFERLDSITIESLLKKIDNEKIFRDNSLKHQPKTKHRSPIKKLRTSF
jgi:Rrf2 family protein